jgi:tRNA-5-taurinomethyluridine 2-sulfurtransferase
MLMHSPDRRDDGIIQIVLDVPQHGGSPGQIAALWSGSWCLGCGTIESTENSVIVGDSST